jgi:hypothetical protein
LKDLLLKHTFSSTAIETSLIHGYLHYAVLQYDAESGGASHKTTTSDSLIAISTFLSKVNNLPRSTISQQPHQWSVLLKIINSAVADSAVSTLFKASDDDDWKAIADNLLILLADVVANGLYHTSSKADEDNEAEIQDMGWPTNAELRREQSSLLVPNMAMPDASQMSFDPEATLDLDMLEGTDALEDDEIKPVTDYDVPQLHGTSEIETSEAKVWYRNAILAANIFLKCLEDEDVLIMLKAEGAEGWFELCSYFL